MNIPELERDLNRLLPSSELAEIIGVHDGTLRQWRNRQTGPPYVKLPGHTGRIYYRAGAVLAWLSTREHAA